MDVLAITVTGLPATATLSKGSRMDDGTWRITQDEFGSLELQLPMHFSGTLPLTATAFFEEHQNTTLRSRDLALAIQPVPNAPRLAVQDACYTASAERTINLVIESGLIDMREDLSLILRRIPENIVLVSGNLTSEGEYALTPSSLPNIHPTPCIGGISAIHNGSHCVFYRCSYHGAGQHQQIGGNYGM